MAITDSPPTLADTDPASQFAEYTRRMGGGWQTFSMAAGSGFTVPGTQPGPAYAIRGGRVELSGVVTNSSFSGGFTVIATLPTSVPAPRSDMVFAVGGNTTVVRSIRVGTDRTIALYSATASGAWLYLNAASFPI